ncbi:MAG: hypothetical protein IPH07_30945 [Deltaproteobacteria bacterium]|nr:hypothetical protein [Deltaproteobacteria bacterium]MBK8234590.1 hypothetical protein [Deltaproteobacteria bacterium]MBK8715332.1 hypothetical protein [Deltaproteobacteria bacterium]MBP7284965.1 hypothetical protein [Nannocystaceae bacterium]
MRRSFASISVLVLGACGNVREDDGFGTFAATASASATTGDGGSSTAGGSSSGTTAEVGSSEAATTADPDSSSSGASVPACGNAMVELDEECDDGNDLDSDLCTTACTVPRCDDGLLDGAETDIDCGGPCQGCALCLTCAEPDDCGPGLACTEAGRCTVQASVVVDWVANCGGAAQGVIVPDLPEGTYVATAVQSAGTLWLPPFNPPSTGYFYEIECADGVLLTQLRTPPGQRYGTIASAFANLEAATQTFSFAGGDLTCYRTDATCGDNDGMVAFDIELQCDAQ